MRCRPPPAAVLAACLMLLVGGAAAKTCEDAEASLHAALTDPAAAFHAWATRHGKPYAHAPPELVLVSNDLRLRAVAADYEHRRGVWLANARYAAAHNAEEGRPYWLDVTSPLADHTHEEYARLLGVRPALRRPAPSARIPGFMHEGTALEGLPASLDWRAHGAVSEVKNQGQCGSCWAFSATGAIEGANALYTRKMTALSEQELVDCDKEVDKGCSGGMMDNAFDYIVAIGGLDTEADWPYTAEESPAGCDAAKREARHVVTIDGYQDVPTNEAALLKAVAHQPVAVAIEADSMPFQLYAGGVMTDAGCGSQINHGVLVVGYGGLGKQGSSKPDETPYWLIKNSWGPEWGDQGYIKIQMGYTDATTQMEGLCGITEAASYPVKTRPNPPPSPPSPPSPKPKPPTPPPPAPGREKCDDMHTCPPESTCCCLDEVAGDGCVVWGCCPMVNAVCCEDKLHCCPEALPVCDVATGRCLMGGQAPLSIPWFRNQPAVHAEEQGQQGAWSTSRRRARRRISAPQRAVF